MYENAARKFEQEDQILMEIQEETKICVDNNLHITIPMNYEYGASSKVTF